jgi:hypothetical protein
VGGMDRPHQNHPRTGQPAAVFGHPAVPSTPAGGTVIPLLLANAERVPCRDGSFGLVISEYGASIGSDPHR